MGFGSTQDGPEIFIGLVGAVGSDLRGVSDRLRQELGRANYRTKLVRLSDRISMLPTFADLSALKDGPEDERIEALMTAGDRVRSVALRGDAVALLAIPAIQQVRECLGDNGEKPLSRTAYLLHSLKHPEEVRTLRTIYGSSFFQVSVYSPRAARRQLLSERIAKSRKDYDTERYGAVADQLIDRDLKEIGTDLGQDVQATFPEADFFIDGSKQGGYAEQVTRFINLLFGHPFTTPTADEYGMFHAKAAALRSADLSRQVGAVIASDEGEIISEGCNDVPKAGGGAVWEGNAHDMSHDYRDFQIGYDSTARLKHDLISEIFERLKEDWLKPELRSFSGSELATKALFNGKPVLKGTRADSLLEFGRIVHAEMSAITEAARRGLSVRNARLYCTTFPCHMCARHIVAAGLREVIYIEPYPKSLAKELYRKSIRVDDDGEADSDGVFFRPFVGVSPRKYISLFDMRPRKDDRGHAIEWDATKAKPTISQIVDYGIAEEGIVEEIGRIAGRLAAVSSSSEDSVGGSSNAEQ